MQQVMELLIPSLQRYDAQSFSHIITLCKIFFSKDMKIKELEVEINTWKQHRESSQLELNELNQSFLE